MKILKYISLFVVIVSFISCEENEIEYMTTDVSSGTAEFQLHYFVPIEATTSNYIYQVEINDKLYANSTAPLFTYDAIPTDDAAGRFYTVDAGTVNIKLYKGSDLELVYDKDVTLSEGKQNIFIHDFDEAPIVLDNGYPYEANVTEDTDSTCYVKFYNFLYESEGVPTDLKLQYQYVDTETSDTINIGNPVAFGETTGWQPVKVIKSIFNSYGYNRIYYRIKVVDANGNITGELSLVNSSSVYKDYSDYWSEYIGRRYHHIFGGIRTTTPAASVRQFIAL